MFFFYRFGDHRYLHSFPTRRSSDLARRKPISTSRSASSTITSRAGSMASSSPPDHWRRRGRSEEHTSELQSPYDLVCRLLLEKKKQQTDRNVTECGSLTCSSRPAPH